MLIAAIRAGDSRSGDSVAATRVVSDAPGPAADSTKTGSWMTGDRPAPPRSRTVAIRNTARISPMPYPVIFARVDMPEVYGTTVTLSNVAVFRLPVSWLVTARPMVIVGAMPRELDLTRVHVTPSRDL